MEITKLPGYRLACARHVGPYGEELASAWGQIMAFAEKRGMTQEAIYIGISWDDPASTPPEQCRYDACIVLPDAISDAEAQAEGLSSQTVPSGTYACHRRLTRMNEYRDGFMELFQWVQQNAYKPTGMAFELYMPPRDEMTEPDAPMTVTFCLSVQIQ